jgi:hypothetical protein
VIAFARSLEAPPVLAEDIFDFSGVALNHLRSLARLGKRL